ncbi:MAG: hypothetical protein P4L43_05860 [Syntrophobacteraceae bacterium]|nr:hypothetical protein [Syntrophobacteraceae bacterium]
MLINDENGPTLLSWRNDPHAGTGWQVPGGIVRFKETFEERIGKVAESEIGREVRFEPAPIALHQVILRDRDLRGHFISLLFQCFVPATFLPANIGLAPEEAGYPMWHERCPANLLQVQDMYRKFIDVGGGVKEHANR